VGIGPKPTSSIIEPTHALSVIGDVINLSNIAQANIPNTRIAGFLFSNNQTDPIAEIECGIDQFFNEGHLSFRTAIAGVLQEHMRIDSLGEISMPNLPTSPGAPGTLWVDPAAGNALKRA
jgi:hypothetical protein